MEIKCKCCGKKPEELSYYVDQAKSENEYLKEGEKPYTADDIAREDGTYNPKTGMFYCFSCYIKIGMPLGTA